MRKPERKSNWPWIAVSAFAVVVGCGWLEQAGAHGMRLPFDSWGGFTPGVLRCQRVLADSVAQCAAGVWTRQRLCERAKLAGHPCDPNALTAATTALVNQAQDTAHVACTELEFLGLQYLSGFDADSDVSNFCRAWSPGMPVFTPSWPAAAVSAVYGPLEALAAPTAAQIACSDAAADAVDTLMQRIFRTRRQCMDHVASESLAAPNRSALLDETAERIDALFPILADRLAARCGAAEFAALYGRPAATFIAAMGAQADCLGGQFYIQNAVLCPAPVCGNGIVEQGEDCDDGNTNDGDACPSTCTFS